MYYEIVYQDGSHSVAMYESDEEAQEAIQAAHERGTSGGRSIAEDNNSAPATPVAAVFKYDDHPTNYNADMNLSADVAKSEVTAALKACTKDGVVNIMELAAAVRDISNPFVESAPHESNYKVEGSEFKWQ